MGEHKYSPTKKLILNIGPGSSGTRSIFLAASQLNITAYHWKQSSANCTVYLAHRNLSSYSLGSLFDIHSMNIMKSEGDIAFWGDTPVPNDWWSLLHGPFRDRIYYVMTDMDDNRWVRTIVDFLLYIFTVMC